MSISTLRFLRPQGLFDFLGGGSRGDKPKPGAKPATAAAKPAAPAKPARVLNPRTAAPGQDLFILRVAPTCTVTTSLNGRIYTRHNAIMLPMATCQKGCACHYDVMADRRRVERRKHADRRDEIRFEERTDRRQRDRRDPNPWTRGKSD